MFGFTSLHKYSHLLSITLVGLENEYTEVFCYNIPTFVNTYRHIYYTVFGVHEHESNTKLVVVDVVR